MKRPFLDRSNRPLIAGAMFVALLFQAMIPAGFMPASDGSFSLQVCHSGLLTHSGGHSHVEFCPFGALPGAAPISHAAAFLPSSAIAPQLVADIAFRRPRARLDRAHPPRGPPVRLISS